MAKIKIFDRELYYDTTDDGIYELRPDGTYQKTHSGGAALVTDGMDGASTVMLTNATATGTAGSTQLSAPLKSKCTYLAKLGGNNTIAVSATVVVYGSTVPMASAAAANKHTLATLSLSGTGVTDNDTVVDEDSVAVGEHYYPYIWMEVTAISGAGAKVITGLRIT